MNGAEMIRFFEHNLQTVERLREEASKRTEEMKILKQVRGVKGKYISCWRTVNLIFDLFKRSWLRCRHIALIITHFLQGHLKRTKFFGSYRVELVVLLFDRLTDIQNFDVITKRLMSHEIACLYTRLGYLTIFNPMKVEGSHFLNLSNREERIIAKILAVLSAIEPGENWRDESFQWDLEVSPIPGWELTKPWLTEEGMPQRGFLSLNYYSGEGKKLEGICPNVDLRKSLFYMVGVEENKLFNDDVNFITEVLTIPERNSKEVVRIIDRIFKEPEVGRITASAYEHLWRIFLAPFNSTSARIANGENALAVFENIKLTTGRDPVNLLGYVSSKAARQLKKENSKIK